VRVATAKVDKLVDLVGELVIAQSVAGQIVDHFEPDRLHQLREAFTALERNTRELQERVMAVRMQPIGGVFSRFPRVVRDLAAASGKTMVLEILGEETELDKSVIEQLADPITHLVRNSADHGIEPPAERLEAGKPEQGVIRLQAYHEGGNVVVEISDDGRGLDAVKIRAKALERRLITNADALSEEEVQSLIFRPGFSTAEKVTDLSGRGVGMDVVRRNVESLNGSIAVRSVPGRGASFRIRLPLTLAILDGLLLRVGAETYVLPLVSIVESIRPRRADVRALAAGGHVVAVRGEPVPLVRLHAIFGVPDAVADPASGAVVIVEHEGRRLALLVDELLGQQQVVVKTLEANYRKVDGTMGATILGDGRVALILDVSGIATLAGYRAARFQAA
jgi:two-component system chemotaxis sensor kinase CheA